MKLVFLFTLMMTTSVNAAWIDKKAEGWAYHEEIKVAQEDEEHQNEKQEDLSPSGILEKGKKVQKEKLAKALLEPTVENIKDYIEEQKKWSDLASDFSLNWQKVLLLYPHLDRTNKFAVSHYGSKIRIQEELKKREELINKLAKENGLFFFYEGQDLKSKAFASVVKSFAEKYGWRVVACSTDGQILPEFPNSEVGTDTAESIGLEVVPALMVVNPINEKIVPIAYGMVAIDEIEKNIAIQFDGETND